MPELTKQQYSAINAPSGNGSIIVSAGAGAGKTFVLVNRIINSLETTPLNEFLVVTYTKAAANEMRQRISDLLEELVVENPNNDLYKKQQSLLQSTQISTVHSFCKNLLSKYHYKLNISPNFRVADEGELSVIKQKAFDETMDIMYDRKNPYFYDFIESFSSEKNDRNMEKLIYQLFDFSMSHPFPEKWLDEISNMFITESNIEESQWGKVIIDYAKDLCSYIINISENNYKNSFNISSDKLREKYIDCFESDINILNKIYDVLENGSWNEIFQIVNTTKLISKPRVSSKEKTPLLDQLDNQRETVKDYIKTLSEYFIFDENECMTAIKSLAPIVRQYTETTKLFIDLYRKKKQEQNIMDYSDLEHYTLKLLINDENGKLTRTDIAEDIAKSFSQIIVDEFQDTNEIQDRIFNEISYNGKDLFVVGDPKQSIYSFRQAKPQIFINRRDKSKQYDAGVKGNVKIDLDKNFRSRPEVIDSCNFICRNIMSKKVGGLDYDVVEELKLGADFDRLDTRKETELHLLKYDKKDKVSAEEVEAEYIANIIKDIIKNTTIYDKGTPRPAKYSDICILLRSKKNVVEKYVETLYKKEIPIINESSTGLLSSTEIATVMAFLRVIDNPLSDVPLMAIMMCSIYGFTVDDLAVIREKNKDVPLYSNIINFIDNEENISGFSAIVNKCNKLMQDISYYRKLSATVTIDELIEMIYEKSGYQYIVRSMPNSDLRLRNLRKFKEYAVSYSQKGVRDLGNFINFLDLLHEQGKDMEVSSVSSEGQNVVKIMSIHASKGLEYPICILAGCSRNFKNETDSVIFHSELGIGMNRFDKDLKCSQPTFIRKAVSIKKKQDEKSEEIRILYVALTRAREKLILICSTDDTKKMLDNLSGGLKKNTPVNSYKIYSSNNYSDMILSCALKCKGCDELRNMAQISDDIVDDNSPEWIFKYSEYEKQENIDIEEPITTPKPIIPKLMNIISERFSYNYPDEVLTKIPTMVSVSEISHQNEYINSNVLKKPNFTKNNNLSATERGTATHEFMQNANYFSARQDIQSEINRLVDNKYITKLQGDSIDKGKVLKFLNSNLMDRILKSNNVYKEYRFVINIKANEIDSSIESQENVVMQGAVDCVFVEGNELVIVDYKTDKIYEPEKFIENYSKQLKLYKFAMERCMQMKVKECIIYSINLNREILVT